MYYNKYFKGSYKSLCNWTIPQVSLSYGQSIENSTCFCLWFLGWLGWGGFFCFLCHIVVGFSFESVNSIIIILPSQGFGVFLNDLQLFCVRRTDMQTEDIFYKDILYKRYINITKFAPQASCICMIWDHHVGEALWAGGRENEYW